ncbi:MAG TPA: FKBP-type peptidyl-prolyl cis-trans isomerase [Nitrospira sp.]|nr:FKBP-type peptidyl-prolyl cis-trans isomerase [Nitrospira sp.]
MKTTNTPSSPERQIDNRRVQWGDRVRVDFMAWLEDGTLVDSSVHSGPVTFVPGRRSVMPGLENLVIGMTPGESRTQRIPPDLAFGPYRPELSWRVQRNWLQAKDVIPWFGLGLGIRMKNRSLARMIITELDDELVTLDANHRLAGKSILVQLDLLEILNAPNSDRAPS